VSEREPTLRDVLGAVSELRGELGEVRIGLGDVRGRLDRLGGEVTELRGEVVEQGRRQDHVDNRLNSLTREVETLRTDLPAQVVAGVLVGFERSAYATDLRTLQAEVAELKADMAELKRASGE
jgi:chromosome segregation ATPase